MRLLRACSAQTQIRRSWAWGLVPLSDTRANHTSLGCRAGTSAASGNVTSLVEPSHSNPWLRTRRADSVVLHRADVGQDGLGSVPVARVAAVPPGRAVAVVAEVVGELTPECGLHQPAFASQCNPPMLARLDASP
jgi:hypothetical protein